MNLAAGPPISELARQAREASAVLASSGTQTRNQALYAAARELSENKKHLQSANQQDLHAGRRHGLSEALLDRLSLNNERIDAMVDGLHQIAALPDLIGSITDMRYQASGIQVGRMRVPIGVIAMIYESRPNVTADAAGLCLKSANAVILKGGSEAIQSNHAIAECLQRGIAAAGLPERVVQIIPRTDREVVVELLQQDAFIDVVIPRGGKGLIETIVNHSRIPVIKHLHGVCHVYVDAYADVDMAVSIAVNAKTQRFGVCNAMETLLVHQKVAAQFLPLFSRRLSEHKVELRVCERSAAMLPSARRADEADWSEEYLAPILAVRTVDDFEQAVQHIRTYGSDHTDAIVTQSHDRAMRFVREVDSSSVMVNASTRFADGYEYGLGAEIGISTDRLHVRGPVGVEGLTNCKYVVFGEGAIRH